MIIIGGGITGAGIFREAVRHGARVLLLERNDFAWGTSSRSSKMVHGGLRYLRAGKFRLTRDSVRERQRLLDQAPGLVQPLQFLMPVYKDYGPSKNMVALGLSIYSAMAWEKQYVRLNAEEIRRQLPLVRSEHLSAGFVFRDAQVDDARLVLRLISEGCRNGGRAENYVTVCGIRRDRQGAVAAVVAEDTETLQSKEFTTRVVVNATGVWGEDFQASPVKGQHLRPLRGSHLVFPAEHLPSDKVISFIHPRDHRPVFVFPWEGRALLGTTDVDHEDALDEEPCITPTEAAYLMEGLKFILPGIKISGEDCIASYAGVRPVLSKGGKVASNESREHVVWEDKGLVTVTGGKLTTFRLLALDALKAVRHYLPIESPNKKAPVFTPPRISEKMKWLPETIRQRLQGRYGNSADEVLDVEGESVLTRVGSTNTLWAEIVFAAMHEKVRHLTDLMLRRVRIGLLLPEGGKDQLDRIERLCQSVLAWNDMRWQQEKQLYIETWRRYNAPPF